MHRSCQVLQNGGWLAWTHRHVSMGLGVGLQRTHRHVSMRWVLVSRCLMRKIIVGRIDAFSEDKCKLILPAAEVLISCRGTDQLPAQLQRY